MKSQRSRNYLNILHGLVLAGALFLTAAPQAQAVIIEMDAFPRYPHPSANVGSTGFYFGPAFAFPFVLQTQYHFLWGDVKFQFDTSTGDARMFGDMTHMSSHQPWSFEMTMSGFAEKIGNNNVFQQPGPYETIFDDLNQPAGLGSGFLWAANPVDLQLELFPGVANPAFLGPREWIGKLMDNPLHDAFGYSAELSYESGTPVFGFWWDAWYMALDPNCFGRVGDTKVFLRNPRIIPPIPEPSTFLLLVTGLLGLPFLRKR